MKIFGVCGSPRKNGNAQWAMEQALQAFEVQGGQTAKLLLSEADIKLCDGTLPEELAANPIQDDMRQVESAMLEAEILVFATPTYFDMVTPQLKNFIDRTDPFYKKLKAKKALILVVGQADEESRTGTVNYLKQYCAIAGIAVEGTLTFQATHKGDLAQQPDVTEKITQQVRAVIKANKP